MIADHTRDASMGGIAQRILASAPARFALAGLSMGGYVAFEILRQGAARVARLALLSTNARADTPEQTANRHRQLQLAAAGQLMQVSDAMFERLVAPAHAADAQLRALNRLMAEEVGVEAFARQQRAIMERPDSRPLLAQVRCPTLVLVGEADQLSSPALAAEMADGIARAQLVTIPDCGHLSTLERPQDVTQALLTWLQT